jgi:hypothetical protein
MYYYLRLAESQGDIKSIQTGKTASGFNLTTDKYNLDRWSSHRRNSTPRCIRL